MFSERLKAILSAHPALEVVDASSAEEVGRFMNENSMGLEGFRLNIVRGNDFFSLLRKQGEHSFTFILRKDFDPSVSDHSFGKTGKIVGLASCVYRKALLQGKETLVGYQHDLRLAKAASRSERIQFYSFYEKILLESVKLPETAHCNSYFAAILRSNLAARKALSRENSAIKYALVSPYRSFLLPTLHFGALKIPSLSLSGSGEEVKVRFRKFFEENQQSRFLGATLSDIERILPSARVVECLSNEGRPLASCLLVESAPDRYYEISHRMMPQALRLSALYPLGLTLSHNLNAKQKSIMLRKLFLKILVQAQLTKASFIGFMRTDSFDPLPSWFNYLPHTHVHGALYRVYHREHLQTQDSVHGTLQSSLNNFSCDFAGGFLRPMDALQLEMALM